MPITPHLLQSTALSRGDNATVEVHKDMNGGVSVVLKDGNHPTGYTIRLAPRGAIMLAGSVLEALGVPTKEMFDGYLKHVMEQRGKP